MARKPMNLKRVQLDMPERVLERLLTLVDDTESMSLAEFIRDSLELREKLIRVRKEGKEIYAIDTKTGERERLLT